MTEFEKRRAERLADAFESTRRWVAQAGAIESDEKRLDVLRSIDRYARQSQRKLESASARDLVTLGLRLVKLEHTIVQYIKHRLR